MTSSHAPTAPPRMRALGPPTPASGWRAGPPVEPAAAAAIDVREWRIRTEARANGVLNIAVALLLSSHFAVAPWQGWLALGCGLVLLATSVWLRPSLPMRAPHRPMHRDDAAVMLPLSPRRRYLDSVGGVGDAAPGPPGPGGPPGDR